jgi:hypothetical protein
MADLSLLQIVWPGVSTLLGAGVGGGVTLWANNQNHAQEQAAKLSSRQSQIKDRSFNACVDLLKAAQLMTHEANTLRIDLRNGEPYDVISSHSPPLFDSVRNFNAAREVARMAIPPTVKSCFDQYVKAAGNFSDEVYDWKIAYLKSRDTPTRDEKCQLLIDDMIAKRDDFSRAASTQFNEGVWPDAND